MRPLAALLLALPVLGVAVAADLAQPVAPAAGLLTLALALLLGLGLPLRRVVPRLAQAAALLLPVFALLALAEAAVAGPRGLLALWLPSVTPWQDRHLGTMPDPPWEAARLRLALSQPWPQPRPYPASADEFLFNALLRDGRGDRAGAAADLAEALRRAAEPRPDALLLHGALMRWPQSRPVLEAAALPPGTAARLAALRAPDLSALLPEDPLAQAAQAHALIAATLPQGPTIATAARIVPVLAEFADPDRFATFAATFLDPRRAEALRQGVATLDWVGEMAARRLSVNTLAPPPGAPGQPLLIPIIVPEPARAVQLWDGTDWAEVPQAPGDPAPTLRQPRPFRPNTLRLRYLDRDGQASAEVVAQIDPATAIRAAARQALQRQGVFTLYQPGFLSPGQLNPLPIAGPFRAALTAITWRVEPGGEPVTVPVGVPDAALLAGDPPRILVEFTVPEEARLLHLTAQLAEGGAIGPVVLPIR
ncbi:MULTISPECIES: hypothetical protein [Roseomonadaceae]|uniref:Uncharacterized protein n=1 Tax=Falsiroseomonas oleicola TaxID=2801474 RepID=A0ABS6H5B1_9PROT|nr:hypothetical protein [Roseomonas oleicola]MBU8542696.1 hypothetical protein [Roseomonas oleicola]